MIKQYIDDQDAEQIAAGRLLRGFSAYGAEAIYHLSLTRENAMRRIHNPTRSNYASLLLWVLAFGSLPAMAVGTYYVSPSGSDSYTGSINDPFLTIPRAQTALRAAGGGTVYLRGGTYTLTSTVVFNEQDSNSLYEAYPGEVPIISGGVVLSNWTVYSGDIYTAPVTWNFRGLFKDGVRLNYKNPITYTRTTNGWQINVSFTDSPANPSSLLASGGDWALNKSTNTVYYKTGGGAPTGTIVAGSLGTLFSVAATTETARVSNLTFDHLNFFYNNWLIPGTDDTTYTDGWVGSFNVTAASCGVAGGCAGEIPGAVMVEFGTNVAFRSCGVAHNESSGIVFARGVSNSQVVGSEVWDNAGVGIRIGSKGTTGTGVYAGWTQLPGRDPNGHTLTYDWYDDANWVESSNSATDDYVHDNGVLFPTTANMNLSDLSDPQALYNRTDNTQYSSIVADEYFSSFHGDYNHIAHSNVNAWVGDGGGIYTAGSQVSPNVGFPATLTGNFLHSTNGFGALYTDTANDQYTVSNNVTYNVGYNSGPPGGGISYIVFNNGNHITASSTGNNSTPTAANISSAVASTGPRAPYREQLSGSGSIVDDADPSITYSASANWVSDPSGCPTCYAGTQSYSNVPSAYAQFTFTGTSISLVGETASNRGNADVYIDGVFQTTVDTYSSTLIVQRELYTNRTLAAGTHTIKVVVKGTKNASSTDYYVGVDAFAYRDGSASTTVNFADRPANAPLAGLYNNINWGYINQQYPAGWGSQAWYTGISSGVHYTFINSSSTSAVAQTITLPPGTVLQSFQATATGTASITVSSNGNTTQTFTPTGTWTTFTTGWTGSPTFNLGYTAGNEDVTIQVTGSNGASSVGITNVVFGIPSASGPTTVNFTDRPTAITPLTGVYKLIDWGNSAWTTQFFSGWDYYLDVNNSSTTAVTYTFNLPAGKVLTNITAAGGTGATIRLSQPGTTQVTFNLTSTPYGSFNTGWTSATGSTVTVTITDPTGAWNTAIHTLTYQ